MKKLITAVAAGAMLFAAPGQAATDHELAELRQMLDTLQADYEARIRDLEARLASAERSLASTQRDGGPRLIRSAIRAAAAFE